MRHFKKTLIQKSKNFCGFFPSLRVRGLSNKAILALLFSTGWRGSELCAISRDSFGEAKNGEISIRGKGGKIRVVFISDTAREALKKYLDKRGDTEEALFFLTPRSDMK